MLQLILLLLPPLIVVGAYAYMKAKRLDLQPQNEPPGEQGVGE